jgi:hypothetical protein
MALQVNREICSLVLGWRFNVRGRMRSIRWNREAFGRLDILILQWRGCT